MDLADVLVAAADTNNGAGKTFEVYYKDTAQPVDMYQSLKTCKEIGKECKGMFSLEKTTKMIKSHYQLIKC